MILFNHYGEENMDLASEQASSSINSSETQSYVPEGHYQMDHKTLWFIANGIVRPVGPNGPRPYKSRPPPMMPPRKCFNYGRDHWVRDCPYPRREKPQESGLQPLARFCNDCGIKHLV